MRNVHIVYFIVTGLVGLLNSPLGPRNWLRLTAKGARLFAFRASHKDDVPENLAVELSALEADIEQVTNDLLARFYLTTDSLFLHRDRLSTFIFLHVLRHNLFIIVGRVALQIFLDDMDMAH